MSVLKTFLTKYTTQIIGVLSEIFNVFSLPSRVNRVQHLARQLFFWALFFIVCFYTATLAKPISTIILGVLAVAWIVSGVALNIKRLHDQDSSGWWVLISLIPFINFILFVLIIFAKGTPGRNRFGSVPKTTKLEYSMLGVLLVGIVIFYSWRCIET